MPPHTEHATTRRSSAIAPCTEERSFDTVAAAMGRQRGRGTSSAGATARTRARWSSRICLVVLAVLLATLAAAPAQAITRDQVLAALHVDRQPADYVALVDYSASMQVGNRYGQAVGAVGSLVRALSPEDHLSLVTFAGTPALRYTGAVGTSPGKALAQLPAQATGHYTDIGAALETALGELERPDAAPVAAVVLMTDGKQEPPRGSAYPRLDSPGWNALARRGGAVEQRRRIGAYAFGLTADTDASQLKRVFPNATVVALPPGQLRGYLARVKEEVRIAQARRLIARDQGQTVTVSWNRQQVASLDLTKGQSPVELTLHSNLAYVPVTLSSLALQATGLPLEASGLPAQVTLAPGETRRIPVQLSFSKSGGFHFGHETISRSGTVTLHANATTPWARVLQELQAPFAPRLASTVVPTRATGTIGWSYPALILLAALVALIVAALAYALRTRNPPLRGTLSASGAALQGPQQQLQLSGRRVKIGMVKGSRLRIPGRGRLRGKRLKRSGRRGRDVALEITYGHNGKPQQRIVRSGTGATIDGVSFTYRS